NSNGYLYGTTNFILTGGTWSAINYTLQLPTTIAGSITLSGLIYYSSNTLTWSSGTITSTGSTLTLTGNATLGLGGQAINNLTVSGSSTITLNSDLGINGIFTSTAATAASHAAFVSTNTNPRTITMGPTSGQSVGFTNF